MEEPHHLREFVWLPECTAQMDDIVAKHSADVIDRVLQGVFWGFATNPSGYDKVWGTWRVAKSRTLGLELPMFRIFFQVENEGTANERVLLCWIDEIDEFGETMEMR